MAKKLPPVHPGEILREEFLVPLKLHTLRGRGRAARAAYPDRTHRARRKAGDGRHRAAARQILQDRRAFWMNIQARFDLETAEDVLAPQIKKIASYEAA